MNTAEYNSHNSELRKFMKHSHMISESEKQVVQAQAAHHRIQLIAVPEDCRPISSLEKKPPT
jgi:hypothetical protein